MEVFGGLYRPEDRRPAPALGILRTSMNERRQTERQGGRASADFFAVDEIELQAIDEVISLLGDRTTTMSMSHRFIGARFAQCEAWL